MKFAKTFFAALLACIVASVVSVFIWIAGLSGLLASSFSMPTVVVEPESVLEINFDMPILDAPSNDPLASINMQTLEVQQSATLLRVIQTLELAAEDDRIKGILLRCEGLNAPSMAILEELRAELEQFKESGKFVVAYAEQYSQSGYYLSSVADAVGLQPEGAIMWQGMGASSIFYKGLLDKLDISVHAIRPTECKYKSAVEPYIRTNMSAENSRQMQEICDSFWATTLESVATSREVSEQKLNSAASAMAAYSPQGALDAQMVDALIAETELDEMFSELGVELNAEGRANIITLSDYVMCTQPAVSLSREEVGIIYASGSIYSGEGYDDAIYSQNLVRLIRQAHDDDNIKAVVLRVNSPGGSALASDVIYRELALLRADKPLIVSMGAYAASGGYYISAPADYILADRYTLTGSIGVFGMIPNVEGALNKNLGITIDEVQTNPMANFGTLAAMSPAELAVMQRSVDKVYSRFLEVVSTGRNLPLTELSNIAQGRVWSGVQAKEIGLVDEIGGLKDAILAAATMADLDGDFRLREVLAEPEGLALILSQMQVSISANILKISEKSRLGNIYQEYKTAQQALNPVLSDGKAVYMYQPSILLN